jgi:hypothetical protein
MVQVGKIEKFEPTEINRPLEAPQNFGKPYRVDFSVTETIRGERRKHLNIVLAIQIPAHLKYLRDNHVEVMLVAGPNYLNGESNLEVGIEEEGKPVAGQWYQFRILEPLLSTPVSLGRGIDEQTNIDDDYGRLFDCNLEVIHGRDVILNRARAFQKRYPNMMSSFWYRVPNAFGAQCGYANAFCGVTLPICPETERTLVAILRKPELLILEKEAANRRQERWVVLSETLKGLAPFPKRSTAMIVRALALDYKPDGHAEDPRFGSQEYVQKAASELLAHWGM